MSRVIVAAGVAVSAPAFRSRIFGQLFLLGLLGLLCWFHSLRADLVNTQQPSDFLIFYEASRDALSGADPYQLTTQHLAYIYPPFLAWVLTPLSRLDFLLAVQVWTSVLALAWMLLLRSAVELVWPRHRTVPLMLIWLPSLLCYRFILRLNLHGQVDMLVWALVLYGVTRLRRGQEGRAGAWLATALVIKPIGFLLVPYLALRRRWRCLMSVCLVGFLLMIVPACSYGVQRYAEILRQWMGGRIGRDLTDAAFEAGSSNQSVQATLYRILGERPTDLAETWPGAGGYLSANGVNRLYLGLALFLAAGLLACRFRREPGPLRWGQELAYLVCLTHLISRRTCEYHLVSLVLVYSTVIALMKLPRLGRPRPRSALFLLVAAALVQNFYSPLFVGRALSERLQALGPVPLSLLLLAWLLAARMRPVRPGPRTIE